MNWAILMTLIELD